MKKVIISFNKSSYINTQFFTNYFYLFYKYVYCYKYYIIKMVLVVSSYETYLFLIKISQAKSEKKKL